MVKILNSVDIDPLLIKRFKSHFIDFYYDYIDQQNLGVSFELAQCIINYNAYSFVGILK